MHTQDIQSGAVTDSAGTTTTQLENAKTLVTQTTPQQPEHTKKQSNAPPRTSPTAVVSAPARALSESRNGSTHRNASLAFPETGYVGVAAKLAELLSQHYESPKEFIYIDILALVGLAMSGRVRMDFGDVLTQPRLYIIKVALSGWGRKSSSTKLARNYISEAMERANELRLKAAQHQDALATAEDIEYFRVVPGVGSAEGLVNAFALCGRCGKPEHHGGGHAYTPQQRIALSYDELRRFEKKAGIQNAALLPMVQELYDSNEYANYTKESQLEVKNAHLVFISNTTTENFENLVDGSELADGGFLNRNFFMTGERTKRISRPKAPPKPVVQPIIDELARQLAKVPTDGTELVVGMTAEAERMWDAYYETLEETEENARLDSIGIRLMPLLAFTSGKTEVDADLMQSILVILDFQARVREILRPNLGENPQAKLENKILTVLRRRGALTESELKQYTNARRVGSGVFENVFRHLRTSRQVIGKQVRSGNRTVNKYELNPESI